MNLGGQYHSLYELDLQFYKKTLQMVTTLIQL